MTTEQEALRLADALQGHAPMATRDEAAAMLRKLVAEREADRAAMRRALEALWCVERDFEGCYADHELKPVRAAITDLRQRLEVTT